jgi:hypothetical protein
MNVLTVNDCIWANEQQTVFNCTVQFSEFAHEVPFGCAQFDDTPHAKEIWQRAIAGDFGPISDFVVPPPPPPETTATPPSGNIPSSVL